MFHFVKIELRLKNFDARCKGLVVFGKIVAGFQKTVRNYRVTE